MKKKCINTPCLCSGMTQFFRVMKILSVLLLICSLGYAADLAGQKVDVSIQDGVVLDVVKEIEQQCDFRFAYSPKFVDMNKRVSINVSQAEVIDVLDQVLQNTDLTYVIDGDVVVLRPKSMVVSNVQLQQQQKTITGTITDDTGESLPGVSVVIEGTTNGTITDTDGKYTISNVPVNATLQFSFIGMGTQEIVVGNQLTINVKMMADAIGLQEVVAVGYGSRKKVNLTGSVSSVKFDKLETQPAPNTASLLQGKMPGVTVQAGSPTPGAENVNITIRGQGSFNNNSPLILIDGVEGSLSSIPPSDIESVSVLKDAASASIYGVRAANGVILVTTKRGKSGKPKVSVQINYALQDRVLERNMLDAVEYVNTWNQIAEEEGKGSNFYYYPDEIAKIKDGSDPDHWANTSWEDEVYRIAPMKKAYGSISGGTEKVKYLVSTQYIDQDGIIYESGNKQINTRANIDAEITDRFRAGLDISFVNKHVNFAPVNDYGIQKYRPTIPVKYSNGNYGFADGAYYRNLQGMGNPAYNFSRNHNFVDLNTVTNRAYAELDIVKNLTFRTVVAGAIYTSRHEQFAATWEMLTAEGDFIAGSDRNSASNSSTLDRNFQNENLLTYNFKLKGKHDFKLLAGHSIKTVRHDNHWGQSWDFPNDKLYVLSVGVNDKDVGGEAWESSLQSFFGRMNYMFAEKYLFEANIRSDGSSRFPKSGRYGVFPAFSGAWIITNESFAQNLGPVSTLKLRGSWGKLGNQEIGDYQFQTAIATGADYVVGGKLYPGVSVNQLTNPNIGWESTTMTNIGLDATFFNDKLALTADVFDKTTSDILMRLPVPYTSGFVQGPLQNVGAVQNKGFEVNLQYNGKAGDFNYVISGNLSKIVNEITDFGGLEPSIGGNTINELGYAMNTYYGLIADGFFQDEADAQSQTQFGVYARPGDLKYKDISGPDGVPDGAIDNTYDRTHLGNAFPDFTYSFNLSCEWRGIDFSTFWQGVSGISNVNYINLDVNQLSTNFTDRVLDVNTATYTNGSWPRWGNLQNNRWAGNSSYWIEDGSYLRLKNLELGYTIPKYMINKIGLGSARIYFAGTNLLTISKVRDYDPEKPFGDERAETSYPQTKLYSFGVNLTF